MQIAKNVALQIRKNQNHARSYWIDKELVIDKDFFRKLILLFAITVSVIVIYLSTSPYQNCKRDIYNSFENTYADSSTWSEKSSLIKECINSTGW
jgi:uncharacterized membrane protein YidH (DUF202 family)